MCRIIVYWIISTLGQDLCAEHFTDFVPGASHPQSFLPTNTRDYDLSKQAMKTRAKSRIFKPKVLLSHVLPSTTKVALSDPVWKAAIQDEFDALIKNGTWILVPLPPDRSKIGCKWVYRLKENLDGTINRYKVRLVAKGFHQQESFDFTEMFSPIIKSTMQ